MTLVLDAGALVAIERGDAEILARLRGEREEGRAARTHAGVVGQVWRGGTGRQAVLSRVLAGVEVVSLDDDLGRRAGVLLGRAKTSDVIDAALVLIAQDGDEVFTTDPDDLVRLAEVADIAVDLIAI